MSEIAKQVGARLRAYRLKKQMSQELLAELAGLHPTYIGQLERGEKNATIETVARVCHALGIPMSKLFDHLPTEQEETTDIAAQCYEAVMECPQNEQRLLLEILQKIIAYHHT